MRNGRWFRLDNAGKLYPAVANSRWSSIFRVSVALSSTIIPSKLQEAADHVMLRFPSMKVRLRKGLFWYYLEENKFLLPVKQDTGHPCMPFSSHEDHGYMLRILYYRNRISVEFFHALTDGTGGMIFLKTLLGEYLRLTGKTVKYEFGVMDPKQSPSPDETTDAFGVMPLPKVRVSRKEGRAYHFPAHREIPHTLHLIAASVPCDKLLKKAREMDVTVTVYLTAVFLYVAYLDQKKNATRSSRSLPLRVSVPINMRSFYKTATMRNFSSFINPSIDPRLGDYTFEEIAHDVKTFMNYNLDMKLLSATIATNVADERYLLIRLAPLFIKNFIINQVFRSAGDKLVTSTITNLGVFKLPECMARYVEHAEILLGAPSQPLCNAAVASFGNETRILFTRNIQEATLPREVLRFLVEQGIPVSVESNQEE